MTDEDGNPIDVHLMQMKVRIYMDTPLETVLHDAPNANLKRINQITYANI